MKPLITKIIAIVAAQAGIGITKILSKSRRNQYVLTRCAISNIAVQYNYSALFISYHLRLSASAVSRYRAMHNSLISDSMEYLELYNNSLTQIKSTYGKSL